MIAFRYDASFDGLLCCVFGAYAHKVKPDVLITDRDSAPLFVDKVYEVHTEPQEACRVWNAVEKKNSPAARKHLLGVWLSELPDSPELLFRYMCKCIDSPIPIEANYGDDDVLLVSQIAKKVSHEAHQLAMFVRFEATTEGLYVAFISPIYNVLSLVVGHFKARFRDKPWLLYDTHRRYGFHFDGETCHEITLPELDAQIISLGHMSEELLSANELLVQQMWKEYFGALAIQERKNLKLQRRNMPRRYWKYLPELAL